MLPDGMAVLMGDCLVASFDFQNDFSELTESNLSDSQCRPRVSLEVQTGAMIYSAYTTGSDPDYSVGDDDGDGIADKKINWMTKRSYKRSAPVKWQETTERRPP